MIDLRKYYLDNVRQDEYYFKFYNEINDAVNLDFLDIDSNSDQLRFVVFDTEEVIEKFRQLCQPENRFDNIKDDCWFHIVTFFLYKQGYYIKQFPNILKRPPVNPSDFTYYEIRNWAFSHDLNDEEVIRYATRRRIIFELSFEKSTNFIITGKSLDDLFKKIATNDISFVQMSTNEKLQEITNLIENLLKINGKFVSLEYNKITFGFITNDDIKAFRKKVQCYRHASEKSLKERQNMTDAQKMFLVDYGIIILKTIYKLINS